MASKSMKTSSCKAKGRRCAQEVQGLLLKYAPDLALSDLVVTPSGVPGEDLTLSPAAQKLFPFSVECKNQESINIWQSLEQAEARVTQEQIDFAVKFPILFFRRNRSKLYVALEAEHFLKLVR